jgi:hypothetical protein
MKLRARGNIAEMISRRMQIGDEPRMYGDANYSGLAIELPVTLS